MNSHKEDDLLIRSRKSEKEYHDKLYSRAVLFEPGTWLGKPVKLVIDSFRSQLKHGDKNINVLDLGCGVGRNSIPIAKILKDKGGFITCVDLLDSAYSKLKEYSKQHNVKDVIVPVLADVENYKITKNNYDYIFSVSCIEHVSNIKKFEQVLKNIIQGTKLNGSNCLMIYSNVRWVDKQTQERLQPLIELDLDTDKTLAMLKQLYSKWDLKELFVKPWIAEMKHNDRSISFETDCICLVVKKNKN